MKIPMEKKLAEQVYMYIASGKYPDCTGMTKCVIRKKSKRLLVENRVILYTEEESGFNVTFLSLFTYQPICIG